MGGFLHPLLLWGSALIAVPIIIHLLNRRRYQKLPWAAMSFLLAAHKHNRRRIRAENLLLLFLRCAAVALLAFAVARPFLQAPPPVASAEKRRDTVIALDHSYSMAWRDGMDTPFQRGVQAALQVIEKLKPERGDQVSVLAAKSRPQILSWKEIGRAREALRGLENPGFEASDFPLTLEWVRKAVEDFGEGGEATIVWISDLQKASFASSTEKTPSGAKEDRKISSILSALSDRGVSLQVIDVGPSGPRPANLGLVALESEDVTAEFAGASISFRAQVRNYGEAARDGVRVFLEKDGTRFGSQTVDLPPGQQRDVSFTVPIEEAGSHWVSASIEADALGADDARFHAFWTRPPARILLVDGNPSLDDPQLSETWHLKSYFQVKDEDENPGAKFPFQIDVADRGRFFANPEMLHSFDLCALANIESFPEGSVAKLESFASTGGTVLFLLGDRVEPGYYNAVLRANGSQTLLPARVLSRQTVGSRRDEYFRIAYPDFDHPAFLPFRDPQWKPLLTEVPVYEFWRVTPDAAETGARVLASFDDPDRSPFFIEKPYGRGRVALLTSPANASWNRLGESPKTFLPLFFEMFRSLTAREKRERDLLVRDAIPWTSLRFPRKASWIGPNGARHPVDATPQAETSQGGIERYLLPALAETGIPGIYATEMELALGASGVEQEKTCYAINVKPEEGDLERISREGIAAFFPGLGVRLDESQEPVAAAGTRNADRGEIWIILIASALGILALESALAAWFGRRRSDRRAGALIKEEVTP